MLTPVFVTTGLMARLPGCWLLLYGTAVDDRRRLLGPHRALIAASCFMALGVRRVRGARTVGHWLMAAGFGGLHIVFGADHCEGDTVGRS